MFNDIIRKQSLIELPIKGRSYTWSNMQQDPLLEQLDWFFTSLHWTNVYPNTMVKPLGKPVSDHIPCIISIQTCIPHSKVFRFEPFWILHPGFMDLIQDVWNRPVRAQNAATTLCRKFKALCHALKIWSKNLYRLSVAIANCNETLAQLDELENNRALSIPEANFQNIIKKHLLRLLKYQNQYWMKHCTIRWIKFGDENTKFFQAVATERYRHNNIASFRKEDGSLIDSHDGKEAFLFQTYTDHLGTSQPAQMKCNLPNVL